jgi:hypothetical protein
MANKLPFFDPAIIERWGAGFIREDKIDESLARLLPGVHVTKGRYSYPGRSELRDLAWNHMDQNHRPLIHRTYGEAMRVLISKEAAFTLTRFGNWPVVLPVFDGYYKENGFYQIVCLFGLFVVVNIIECNADSNGTRMDIDWAIASHRFLRFLHGPLNRRLFKLNDVQNREDDEIRGRRIELRARGYSFATDVPDFVNSNLISNNVVFPPVRENASLALSSLADGAARTIEMLDRAYVLRRSGEAVEVFPGICPHEGAALRGDDVVGGKVRCRWHGLEFPARRLVPGGKGITVCGARIELRDGTLRFTAPL